MAKSYFYDEGIADWRELVKGEQGEPGPRGPKGDSGPSTTDRGGNIYISPDGDDANDGFSSDSPIRTFSNLNESLPEIIRAGHTYYIRPMPGVWDEDFVLSSIICHGSLVIRPLESDDGSVKVRTLQLDSVIGSISVENITTTLKDNSGPSFNISNCPGFVRIDGAVAEYGEGETEGGSSTGAAVVGLLANNGSNVYVTNSTFSWKRYGIRSNRLSRIMSSNNHGVGNHRGVGARFGGTVQLHGTQPEGVNQPLTHTSGGLIVTQNGGLIDSDSPL